MRALRKLLLGETWLLPLGLAIVIGASDLVVRPLVPATWEHLGGFILVAAVIGLLIASVARTAGRR